MKSVKSERKKAAPSPNAPHGSFFSEIPFAKRFSNSVLTFALSLRDNYRLMDVPFPTHFQVKLEPTLTPPTATLRYVRDQYTLVLEFLEFDLILHSRMEELIK